VYLELACRRPRGSPARGGDQKEVVKASETICSVSTSLATYPCAKDSDRSRIDEERTHLLVDASLEESSSGKMARPSGDESDVDDLAEDGQLWSQQLVSGVCRGGLRGLTRLIDETVDHREDPGALPDVRLEGWIQEVSIPEPLVVESRERVAWSRKIGDRTSEIVLKCMSEVVGIAASSVSTARLSSGGRERT
jgi:hypothetical protein